MLEPPFDIISCSWPRPVEHADKRWLSEPEWDAPLWLVLPDPHWEIFDDELCWMINWREVFRSGLRLWDPNPQMCGEMRGFHIVFQLVVNGSGTFIFWEDNGSLIRRNGELIHCERGALPLSRHEIEVHVGDHLEVGQWLLGGDCRWGAHLRQPDLSISTRPTDMLRTFLERVQKRLAHPNGPPLKIFTHGHTAIRTIVSIYSMILNGYVPETVHLFGEHQWSKKAYNLFSTMVPFAHIIPTNQIVARLHFLGGPQLVDMAWKHWYVLKTCASLLYPPEEFCLMDDDVFILDHVDDALRAFQENDLVYTPDQDHSRGFLATWRIMDVRPESLRTKRFNGGLYWLRQVHDPLWVATQILRSPPTEAWHWEQGFIAIIYLEKKTVELSSLRYLLPALDGLPGGLLGYDYALNPCGFASIHFAGLVNKPSDGIALQFAQAVLARHLDYERE